MTYYPVRSEELDIALEESLKSRGYEPLLVHTFHYRGKDDRKEMERLLTQRDKRADIAHALLLSIEQPDSRVTNFLKSYQHSFDVLMGQGGLNKHNRFFIEQTPIDVLVDPQSQKLLMRRDFIHHFNAGLNHVLMKQAAEKGIILLITLNDLKKSPVDEIKGLGRVQQLCSLAGKYGVGISVSSLLGRVSEIRTTSEHQKILALFSASGKQKRDSGCLLTEKIRENAFKHSSSHIMQGLEVMR